MHKLWALYRLSKLARYDEPARISLSYYSVPEQLDTPSPTMKQLRKDVPKLLAEMPNAFRLVTSDRKEDKYSPRLAILSDSLPSMRAVAEDLRLDYPRDDRPLSTFEMLATVLMVGDPWGAYGSYYSSDEYDQLHLMVCGIDWDKFTGVHMSSWSEWGGTFGEDEYSNRLTAEVECRCGSVDMKFGMEPPSVADLFVHMSADTIEKLYNI